MARLVPLHERVCALLNDANIDHAELAKLTGWHELRVWRLLTGRTRLSAVDIEIIAKSIKRPVQELYAGKARVA